MSAFSMQLPCSVLLLLAGDVPVGAEHACLRLYLDSTMTVADAICAGISLRVLQVQVTVTFCVDAKRL